MKQDLFISYCWRDGLYYADELQAELEGQFHILRDKKQDNSDDIYEYMSQVEECDNVVIVLTDAYMHSLNCMLEVSFLLDGENWANRMTLLVLDNDIYTSDRKLAIVEYWHQRQLEINEKIQAATSGIRLLTEEKQQIDAVVNTVEEFLDKVGHLKNPSQIAIVGEIKRKALAREAQPDYSLRFSELSGLREELVNKSKELGDLRDELTRKSHELRSKEVQNMEERRAKVMAFLERHSSL